LRIEKQGRLHRQDLKRTDPKKEDCGLRTGAIANPQSAIQNPQSF
jgi:hypothetical protein